MSYRRVVPMVLIVAMTVISSGRVAQSNPSQQKPDEKHHEEVNRHGDMAMGFSHLKTTHHFRLTPSGGSIQVQTNDPNDTSSRDQIRMHLQHVAGAFKEGDFSSPGITHSRVPPGVPMMRKLKSEINYTYEETEAGGKVLISTANPKALKAVHQFLRFQIDDHQTGDPKTVQS